MSDTPTPAPSSHAGSCYCGAVRFEFAASPRFICHCHCDNCRRAHGAGFVTWSGFPEQSFRLTAGEEHLGRYLTETRATRGFCSICGSSLFYTSPRWPGEVHVTVANLDEAPEGPSPIHIYADRSPAWCPVAEGLPRHGGETGIEPLD